MFRNFFRCRVISKNKLEIIELFGYVYQIAKKETHFSRINDGPAYFSYSVLEQPKLPYAKEVLRKFFRCRVISKNKLELIELFGDFYQIVKIETPFLQN